MHPTQAILYDRLERFPIDDGDPAFPFEARLAADNTWSRAFARRVTTEYRRFLFLAATTAEPVTPSRIVDEAWHLHLTYTRSYWDRLCGELLGKPLHHDPTRGGAEESAKFNDQYTRTLAAYRHAFGQEPPADVWPTADAPARPRRIGRILQGVAALTAVVVCAGCGLVTDVELLWLIGIGVVLGGLTLAGAIYGGCRGPKSRKKRRGDGSFGGWFVGGGCSCGDSGGGGGVSGCGASGDCGDAGGGGAGCGGGGGGGGGCGGGGGGGGCGGGGGGGCGGGGS